MTLEFLAGIRVLDLSQYVPGPYAGLMLADLGADVVKVEPPSGDPMRRLLLQDADGISPFWKAINGGKTIVTLDLKAAAGAAQLAELARRADVLVESYRPGAMDRLGFGSRRLLELNPRLIHAALSGYGRTGPWRQRVGHDVNYMAVGGGLAGSGAADRPILAIPPTSDFASGIQAALAICAALIGRGRTGRGAVLDLSLAETVLAWQSQNLTAALRAGRATTRASQLLGGGAACYQIYGTADRRFVSLGAIEEKFWANLCAAVERPEWIERQWEPMPQHDLIAAVAACFAGRSAADWEALLGEVDCCFAVVAEPSELTEHPQIAARRMLAVSAGGDPRIEALFPAWVDGAPPAPRRPPIVADPRDVIARWPPPA